MSIYIIPDPTEQELWFDFKYSQLGQCINVGDWKKAEDIAYEWAEGISDSLSIESVGVWKYFKRSLAAKWFGKPQNKRFSPGWSVEVAMEYATKFKDRPVRFSLFPKDIACHATSNVLPLGKMETWSEILSNTDNSIAMEMFPETSTDSTICIRRYSTQFSEVIFYEAGKGQAMTVFEQERGLHPVVSANLSRNNVTYSFEGHASQIEYDEIKSGLTCLIQKQNPTLSSKCFGLCRSVGIDHVSIEGYFNLNDENGFIVVDIDLPFDVAFMGPRK